MCGLLQCGLLLCALLLCAPLLCALLLCGLLLCGLVHGGRRKGREGERFEFKIFPLDLTVGADRVSPWCKLITMDGTKKEDAASEVLEPLIPALWKVGRRMKSLEYFFFIF